MKTKATFFFDRCQTYNFVPLFFSPNFNYFIRSLTPLPLNEDDKDASLPGRRAARQTLHQEEKGNISKIKFL